MEYYYSGYRRAGKRGREENKRKNHYIARARWRTSRYCLRTEFIFFSGFKEKVFIKEGTIQMDDGTRVRNRNNKFFCIDMVIRTLIL